ncbi:MAG: C40 family peptidase [Acidimicrobiales bacterium]
MSIAFDDSATSGPATKLAAAAAGLVLLVTMLAAAGAGAGIASLLGGGGTAPSATATSAIPPAMLALYQQAAVTCPGLPWTVLAAIGTVESDNGTSALPGVRSGANSAGAEGPMQFEPATFAAYDQPVPPGGASPPSPYDPTDAVYAAARMLCANGAANGADISGAVFAYNHASWYVTEVLSIAQSYGQSQAQTVAAGTAGGIALDWALAQVGTPYIWGGETPGVGFDCSGLTQAAYRAAGVALPRTAQEQYDAGPAVPANAPLQPGDLVFFGSGPTDVSHVGIYVGVQDGQSVMVDSPHTGADVRVEPFPSRIGASWGTDSYLGATQPV